MSEAYNWYSQLKKPSWSPPSWLFGPVWTVLYVLIAVSFGAVFVMAGKNEISWMITLPFVLNLIFNFAFTYIQFGLKNNLLAAIDILLVLATLIWAMVAIFPFAAWVAYINTPYLLWVCFATILQLTITNLNKKHFTFMLPMAVGFWRKINNGTSSKIKYKIILVAVLVVLFFVAARLISPEDAWLCQNGQWVKHGNPAAQMPTAGCGQTTSTNQTSAKPEALVVDFPRPNDEITSPLKITGQARGEWFFEASFPVVLTNWDGLIIAQGAAMATGDWMTQNFVPFEATLEFTKPDYKNNGFLILKKDNPSGLPQNDASYEIPIIFK